jgi:peptidoglycan-N-acetylglucosamine deacetylase
MIGLGAADEPDARSLAAGAVIGAGDLEGRIDGFGPGIGEEDVVEARRRNLGNSSRQLRALGYVYDSSDKDFDLPYLLRFDGQEHDDYVCLPNNTSSLDDFPFYRVSYTPPSEVLTHWTQEFDAIYAEGGYFNLTVHPRVGYGSGSPARVAIVEKLIEYVKRHDGVRFAGMLELAQWCLKRPADWRRDWSGQ